jgi:hypothetical protein
MRVYLDTEFTQFTQPQLISLGLAADDNREFYAVMKNLSRHQCSAFVQDIVLPIIDDDPNPPLDGAEFRQSLLLWLQQCNEPAEIVCDFTLDAELLMNLVVGDTKRALIEFNIGRIAILAPAQYEQTADAVDAYFAAPRDWPRHHALEDARALRAACVALSSLPASKANAISHG